MAAPEAPLRCSAPQAEHTQLLYWVAVLFEAKQHIAGFSFYD
ncbi:unnamed protein product [Ixodes pacificus]